MAKLTIKSLIKCSGTIMLLSSLFLFTGCWSVFSGGTSGIVVDAESAVQPKEGIANVDVYAYTKKSDRDNDFNNWKEETVFTPSTEYYGHTTTAADGSFVISKMVWKSFMPEFGKDADYQTVYLLYYHESYGLTKGETVLISDTTSTTVYQELTAKYQRTNLAINCIDVATDSPTSKTVTVKLTIPQKTYTKVYIQAIAGTGIVPISFPKDVKTTITVEYYENTEDKNWQPCYNKDNPAANYAFRNLQSDPVKKEIPAGKTYTINLYGKATKLAYPAVSGTCGDVALAASDGKLIELMGKDSGGNFTVDLGNTYTMAIDRGTTGEQTHGYFTGLGGSSYSWTDTSYPDRFAETQIKLMAEGGASKTITVRSDNRSYNIKF